MSAITTPPAPAGTTTPPPAPHPAWPRTWRWTTAQYHELGRHGVFDGKRVELIRGEIVEMSPINWPHIVATSKTGDVLRTAFAGVGTVIEQGSLPTTDSDPIPDVRVIPGALGDYAENPPTALLLVEVADTTLFHDTTTKAELYATAGVRDYWVLDLEHRQLIVFRDPRPLHSNLAATAYNSRQAFGPDDTVAPLAAPGAAVRVADLLP